VFTQAAHLPSTTKIYHKSPPLDPTPAKDEEEEALPWFCLLKMDTRRVSSNSPEHVQALRREGAFVVKIVRGKAEAMAWVKMGPPHSSAYDSCLVEGPATAQDLVPTPAIASSNGFRRGAAGPSAGSGTSVTPDGLDGRWKEKGNNNAPPNLLGELLDKVGKYTCAPDPSVGTSQVFGMDPADAANLDNLLLPPIADDSKTKQDFYDLAMDVANLPGAYRQTDDDDASSSEALAHALGRSRSTFYRSWRKVTHNSLGRIKSLKELLQMAKDLERSVERQRRAQDQRMRSFLYDCRLPQDVIGLYLQSGLLIRVLRDTYRYYHGLVETCRTTAWEMPQATWKDGYVDQMIQHHARELWQIRSTATDYRMHLLETYVYLRNAHHEKYQDPAFTRYLLYSVAKGTSGGEDHDDHPSPSSGDPEKNRCKHCRRSKLHTGTATADCPLKALTSRQAQEALQNLNKLKCKAVCKFINEKLAEDSSLNHAELITAARASV
jgi:hypothetical protein